MTTMANQAAKALGLSEEVINRFLSLVDELEKNNLAESKIPTSAEASQAMEALMQEYVDRL